MTLAPLEPIHKSLHPIDLLNFSVTPKYFSSMTIPMSLREIYYFRIKNIIEE